jgi:hypothetical protein
LEAELAKPLAILLLDVEAVERLFAHGSSQIGHALTPVFSHCEASLSLQTGDVLGDPVYVSGFGF